MAHVKNTGGGPGDEDPRRPPRLPADPKGKATKKLATKKRKYPDVDTARAAVVTEVADRAERGGARSDVVIAYQLWRDDRASEGFYTPLQEDFYNAYLNSGALFRSQRVSNIESIVAAAGEHIRPYLAYLPGLTDLLRWTVLYVPSWVR